jgi:aminoglycoside phosphotransferase (APT) family kinase protein
MSPAMHDGEILVQKSLARRLLASQFPQWSELPLELVEPAGTDHTIYRLGAAMSLRLPRIDWAADQPSKEFEWLPRIARQLSIAVPEPLGLGEPAEGYRSSGWFARGFPV